MSVFVMSDIHGLKDRFFKMLEKLKLKEDDHVYILGDVIDRGPDGIELLQYIRKQKQFTLLMGNHELMMMEYYDEIINSTLNDMIMKRWLRNGCEPTMRAFEKLDGKQQEQLLAYLRSLPLAISDLLVNHQKYYLVHAAPVISLKTGNAYLDSDFMKLFTPSDFVWNRLNGDNHFFDDRIVIVGHTITAFYQQARPYSIWYNHSSIETSDIIDIDCGCACNDSNTQLACLRLDDLKVFYV